MEIRVFNTKQQLGEAAAKQGAEAIRSALRNKGKASIIVATGASQFEMLEVLIREPDIDWSNVTAFHLDEYVGMKKSHPASFRRYLIERFVEPLGGKVTLHEINAEDNPEAETGRLSKLIMEEPIDVCFAGIGENCHLAFNDPPADFETDKPYIIVHLDEACRRQQMGEGWFATLEDVPAQAISMSIKQIMKSKLIILSVPDQRKAQAVKNALEGSVTPLHPASILQNHNNTMALLDTQSASLLSCAPKA